MMTFLGPWEHFCNVGTFVAIENIFESCLCLWIVRTFWEYEDIAGKKKLQKSLNQRTTLKLLIVTVFDSDLAGLCRTEEDFHPVCLRTSDQKFLRRTIEWKPSAGSASAAAGSSLAAINNNYHQVFNRQLIMIRSSLSAAYITSWLRVLIAAWVWTQARGTWQPRLDGY